MGEDGRLAGTLWDEPLTRMLLRHDDFETGVKVLRDRRGMEVVMDAQESRLMFKDRGAAAGMFLGFRPRASKE